MHQLILFHNSNKKVSEKQMNHLIPQIKKRFLKKKKVRSEKQMNHLIP